MTQITVFRNIKDTSTPFFRHIDGILARIKEGKNKDIIKRIREEKNRDVRNVLKQELPAICFSGTFNTRNDKALIDHSGFICLDFDGFDKQHELIAKKQELTKDKYTYSVFVSPSGDGLKLIVRIPKDADNHKHYFKSLEGKYNSPNFDIKCSNISRVCYESYDPLIFINPNSAVWMDMSQGKYEEMITNVSKSTIKLSDQNEVIRRLRVWWDKNYGMVVGERNNNVFILASRYNKFGINKDLAMYALSEFAHEGFEMPEIKVICDSAYRNKDEHNTRFFEDIEKVDSIKKQLKAGVSKKEIRLQLRESDIEDDVIDATINSIEDDSHYVEFWQVSEKGSIRLLHYKFKEFLEDNGYYKYSPEGTKNYIFVKVTNNLIDNTTEEEIKDFILTYILKCGDMEVYNFFADKTRFFKEDFLTMLSHVDVYFISDEKDNSYLYFRNCAVKVTCNDITIVDYLDLGGYVWKDQVIDRDFAIQPVKSCDYKRFISNIAGNEHDRIMSVESTIGYLLHGFKNVGYCPAVIINDEVISDNPEGGTGKGLFVNAISKMKKMVIIDGKQFSFEKSFAYQLVSADTQILTFDDVKKHFDFERLFSIVTEGITLEKKNKDAIKIPFSRSPKIVITTNYAIKGKGNSFERRKWELEFKKHYSKDFTPEDDFGRLLFSDWDEDEWLRFDNYMISNLRLYLCEGFVKSDFKNLKTRKFIAETDHNFWEWVINDGTIETETKYYKQQLYDMFVSDNPDFGPRAKMSISMNKFYSWLDAYGLYTTGILPESGRDGRGRWIMYYKHKQL